MKNEVLESLENLVRNRKKAQAVALAKAIKAKAQSDREIFDACCDAFRRLGLYKEGLKLVNLQSLSMIEANDRGLDRLRLVWTIRFFSLLGASEFALTLAKRIHPKTNVECRVVGEVFLANFMYENAIRYFEEMVDTQDSPTSYAARIARLSLADAYVGAGRFREAQSIAKRVYEESSEETLMAICQQALGEYFAREGKLKEASSLLMKSLTMFSSEDRTADYALALKWNGYVQARLGDAKVGAQQMNMSVQLLQKLGIREEAWVDVLRLKHEAGVHSKRELVLLGSFPGLAPGLKATLPVVKSNRQPLRKTCSIEIDFASKEFRVRSNRYLGLPLEVKLLGYIRLAHPNGLRILKALALLWPDEVYAFLYLESRLYKLLNRINRIYGIAIKVDHGVIRFNGGDSSCVAVSNAEGEDQRPSFLLKHRSFTTKDLCLYYGLRKSQASKQIGEWRNRGWIRSLRDGRTITYIVEQAASSN